MHNLLRYKHFWKVNYLSLAFLTNDKSTAIQTLLLSLFDDDEKTKCKNYLLSSFENCYSILATTRNKQIITSMRARQADPFNLQLIEIPRSNQLTRLPRNILIELLARVYMYTQNVSAAGKSIPISSSDYSQTMLMPGLARARVDYYGSR